MYVVTAIAHLDAIALAFPQNHCGRPQQRGPATKELASQSNFTLSTGLTPEDNSTKSSLSSTSGSQFDQKYIQPQLQDHKKAIALFEKEISAGQDPQLKGFAQKTLPVLQDHMRIAEDLAGKLGLSGKMGLTDSAKAVNSGNQHK